MKSLSPNKIFLLLTLIFGIFIISPLYNFQAFITQGDIGRDLYCYKMTLDGYLPYHDFWWIYGPLMPYYYALFFVLFGVTIKSLLLGKLLLLLLSGTIVYLILANITMPLFAMAGAVWFWTFMPDFIYTYNHIGGIVFLLLTLYFLSLYILKPNERYIYSGIISTFILSIIKVNIGITSFAVFIISIIFIDFSTKNSAFRKHLLIILIAIILKPIYLFLTHWPFVSGLPLYSIRQCLPLFGKDCDIHSLPIESLLEFTKQIFRNIGSSTMNLIIAVILIFSIIRISLLFLKNQNSQEDKQLFKQLYFHIWAIILFIAFTLHEFLISGIPYKIFWIDPLKIILIFIILYFGVYKTKPIIKNFLAVAFIGIALNYTIASHQFINLFKKPSQFLNYSNAQIYTTNSADWLQTVNQTVSYINQNLKKDETFMALPYEPLYYYLTKTKSPTRQIIFFEHIYITPKQELEIINDLNNNNTNYILISNRSQSDGAGLGFFGKTYCPILGKYISDNFELTATFGDWDKIPPGTYCNHAVKIYKRKSPN